MPRTINPNTFNKLGQLLCTHCNSHLPLRFFSNDKNCPNRSYRGHRCKPCRSKYAKSRQPAINAQVREWVAKNKEKHAATSARWRANNPASNSTYNWRLRRGVVDGVKYDWVVYKLVFDSGHFYIGSTCQLYTRLSAHKSKIKLQKHSKALNQMKDVPYKVEILFESSEQAAVRAEEYRLFDEAMEKEPLMCLNKGRHATVYANAADPAKDFEAAAASIAAAEAAL